MSTDGSGDIAQSYGKPLKYFRGKRFLPLGAARNLAIEKAMGKYIALLDCDDIWLPEKLQKQVGLIQSDPDLALIYSDVYLIDKAGRAQNGTYFDTVEPCANGIFFRLLADTSNPITCSTILFHKSVFDDVGGFNPDFSIVEEYDLFLKMFHRHKAAYVDSPLAKLRQYSNSYSRRNLVEMSLEKLIVMESAIDMLKMLTRDQAKQLKKKLRRLFCGLIWANIEERRFTRALTLPFKLAPKYALLSAKLSNVTSE